MADHFLRRITEQFFRRRVGHADDAFIVDRHHAIDGGVDQRFEHCGFAHFVFHKAALAQIARRLLAKPTISPPVLRTS